MKGHSLSPVLATQPVSKLGQIQPIDLCLNSTLDPTLRDAPQSGKHGEQLPASEPFQQSIKLWAVANALLHFTQLGVDAVSSN